MKNMNSIKRMVFALGLMGLLIVPLSACAGMMKDSRETMMEKGETMMDKKEAMMEGEKGMTK